jgi:hypothetical protein
MSRNSLQFRPTLENLDGRAMPSSLGLAAPDSGEVTRADIEPVVDKNGDYWLCRETDDSCECIPWPG